MATKQDPAKLSSMMTDWQVEWIRLAALKEEKKKKNFFDIGLPIWVINVL